MRRPAGTILKYLEYDYACVCTYTHVRRYRRLTIYVSGKHFGVRSLRRYTITTLLTAIRGKGAGRGECDTAMPPSTDRRMVERRGTGTSSVMRQAVQMSKVKANRVVFKSLPSFCSNDLVEGSWWMVWASLVSAAIACVPLADIHMHFFDVPKNTELAAFSQSSTWILAIVMGVFFTLGSFAFVRAFDDPPVPPLFSWRHFGTDELLGAWLTFLGSTPAIFFCLVFVVEDPTDIVYWGGFVASILFNLGAALFVYTCYGHESTVVWKPYTYLCTKALVGNRPCILNHVANDWLAACWFFLFCSVLWALGSIVYICIARNERQDFIYAASLADAVLFVIGSAYFVAGSYPMQGTASSNVHVMEEDYVDTSIIAPMHSGT